MLGVWRTGAGKRCSECGGLAPESDARSVEEWRRKAMLGVWRNGAGKRCSECGGMAPESDARSVEEWHRKAMLGVWRNSAGKRCLEFTGLAPESKAWNVAQDCAFDKKCRLVPKVFCTKTAQSSRPTKPVEQYQRYSIPRLRSPSYGRQSVLTSTKDILYQDCAVHLTADKKR